MVPGKRDNDGRRLAAGSVRVRACQGVAHCRGAELAMREQPLPPELAAKWGHLPFIKYHGNGEFSAACPRCGDSGHIGSDPPDRFRMFSPEPGKNARGWCRACSFFAWADEGEDYSRPSPEAIAAAQAERERLAAEELERTKAKLRAIQASPFWREWHEQMTAGQRAEWHRQGVIDYFIDYYQLGWVSDHTYFHAGQFYHSPAMTIPHYEAGDENWRLANIQYRLVEPARGAGKYRMTKDLPAALFRTEPDEPLTGAVLVVEGAKKAIVTYTHLGSQPLGERLSIVAIPSKTPSDALLSPLAGADLVYLGLDPDAYVPPRNSPMPAAQSIAQRLGQERVRYVHFPAKPDDLIVQYGLDGDALKKYLRAATRTA